jgi:hypothetical protein
VPPLRACQRGRFAYDVALFEGWAIVTAPRGQCNQDAPLRGTAGSPHQSDASGRYGSWVHRRVRRSGSANAGRFPRSGSPTGRLARDPTARAGSISRRANGRTGMAACGSSCVTAPPATAATARPGACHAGEIGAAGDRKGYHGNVRGRGEARGNVVFKVCSLGAVPGTASRLAPFPDRKAE